MSQEKRRAGDEECACFLGIAERGKSILFSFLVISPFLYHVTLLESINCVSLSIRVFLIYVTYPGQEEKRYISGAFIRLYHVPWQSTVPPLAEHDRLVISILEFAHSIIRQQY